MWLASQPRDEIQTIFGRKMEIGEDGLRNRKLRAICVGAGAEHVVPGVFDGLANVYRGLAIGFAKGALQEERFVGIVFQRQKMTAFLQVTRGAYS